MSIMTDQEMKVIMLLADVWNEYKAAVVMILLVKL